MKYMTDAIAFRLMRTSWILPGLPLLFVGLYLILSVIAEPFRPDLMYAEFIALVFGVILTIMHLACPFLPMDS